MRKDSGLSPSFDVGTFMLFSFRGDPEIYFQSDKTPYESGGCVKDIVQEIEWEVYLHV